MGGKNNPTSPFKFNPVLIKVERFISLVKDEWVPYDPRSMEKKAIQYLKNLKRVNKEAMKWVFNRRIRDDQDLIAIESSLQEIYEF